MPDLNIDVKRTFGKRLPTAFIKRIEIHEGGGDPVKWSDIDIAVDINFTMKKEVTNFKDAIGNNFRDLYLYIFFCKSTSFVNELRSNTMSLKRLFKYNQNYLNNPTARITARELLDAAGDTATDVAIDKTLMMNQVQIPLSNLKEKIVEEGLYDANGDRILKISNVKFRTSFLNTLMGSIDNATVMTFVGRSNSKIANLPDVVHKRNFGDISYEVALMNNRVPATTQLIYVDSVGNQYNGRPLRAIRGRYHVSEPVSAAIIIDNFRNLMAAYQSTGDVDEHVTSAFNNLEYLLARSEGDPEIMITFNLYRKAYPDKSNATPAGRFYDLFKKRLLHWNRLLSQQDRLYKRLVLNSKTSDFRGIDLDKYDFVIPNPDAAELEMTTAVLHATGPENYFISEKMVEIDRTTQLTIPLKGAVSDYLQFVGEEGLENLTHADAMWNAKYDNMFAASLDEQYNDAGSTDGFGTVRNSFTPIRDADTVVKNKGIFFFDWERALHVKSRVARLFRLHYLQKFLGMHVPYELFRIDEASLHRREILFKSQNEPDALDTGWKDDAWTFEIIPFGEGWGWAPPNYAGPEGTLLDPEFANVTMTAKFDDTANFPRQIASRWKMLCHQHESYLAFGMPYVYKYIFGAIDQTTATLPHQFNSPGYDWATLDPETGVPDPTAMFEFASTDKAYYGGPLHLPWWSASLYGTANDVNVKARASSYLKLKNFDLPRSGHENRLEGYSGTMVGGGYRMMCFEFQDFMDDDVAYYNTLGTEFGGVEKEKYPTSYTMSTHVKDSSLNLYHSVKKLLEGEYQNFMLYYEKAKEVCSYNNIDDVFNEFFITAMQELEMSGAQVAWYRAPGVYYSFMAILTNIYSGTPLDEIREHIISDAQMTAGLLSPTTGRFSELEAFRVKFGHLLGMFRSNIIPAADWGPQAGVVEDHYLSLGGELPGTPNPVFSLDFNQSRLIDQDIFGNLYLSAWSTDDIDPGDLMVEPDMTIEPPDDGFDMEVEEGGPPGSELDPDYVHMGVDLRLLQANYFTSWNARKFVNIFAGKMVKGDPTHFVGSSPPGYALGQEHRDWEGGYSFADTGASRQVYLPPGDWTITWRKNSTKAFWYYCIISVPPMSNRKDRIRRTSGSGKEFTEAGLGPGVLVWPLRNGNSGDADWSDPNDYLVAFRTHDAPHNSVGDDGIGYHALHYNFMIRDDSHFAARKAFIAGPANGDLPALDPVHWSMYYLCMDCWYG